MASATIGARVPSGTTVSAVRFSCTIRPQSGVGGFAPKPRKDSDATSSTIHEARIAYSTSTTSSTFGRISRNTIDSGRSPRARAAVT